MAITNPRGLLDRLVSIIINAGRCPICLGVLGGSTAIQIGTFSPPLPMQCVDCQYDAKPWILQSIAKHDRAWDNREG